MDFPIIYKIQHLPSGLFYCSRKGRFTNQITNLSTKGNIYEKEETARKVLDEDCERGAINEAQAKKYKLTINKTPHYHSLAKKEDFIIKKYYLLSEVDFQMFQRSLK